MDGKKKIEKAKGMHVDKMVVKCTIKYDGLFMATIVEF